MNTFNNCYFDAIRNVTGNDYTGPSALFYSVLTPGYILSASVPAWKIAGGIGEFCVRIDLKVGSQEFFQTCKCGDKNYFFICEIVL